MVDGFEAMVAERVGDAGALALSSGTAALHLALLNLGAGPGRVVLVPSMTFAASVDAVPAPGAELVTVDSNADDGNVDVPPPPRARWIPCSTPARTSRLSCWSTCSGGARTTRSRSRLERRGIPLVEDAAEALGANHGGVAAGAFGRLAALSFNGNKIMTTSGGGMLLSDDAEALARARHLSTQARDPAPWYEHTEIGYNYRLSNILAALGVAQLERLDGMIARRGAIRDHYANAFADIPQLRILGRNGAGSDATDNQWLTPVVLPLEWIPASSSTIWRHATSRPVTCGSPCTCSPFTPSGVPSPMESARSSLIAASPCRAAPPSVMAISSASLPPSRTPSPRSVVRRSGLVPDTKRAVDLALAVPAP